MNPFASKGNTRQRRSQRWRYVRRFYWEQFKPPTMTISTGCWEPVASTSNKIDVKWHQGPSHTRPMSKAMREAFNKSR